MDYQKYIKSMDWLNKSSRWKLETGRCEVCNKIGGYLEAHHKHYKTLGRENRKSDIVICCTRCHKYLDYIRKTGKNITLMEYIEEQLRKGLL